MLLLLLLSRFSRVHRRQPTRPRHPWDSLGKNTGVGCHFLLQCMKVKNESEATQSCLTLSDPMDCSLPGSPIYGIFQARVLEWGAIAFSQVLLEGNQVRHRFLARISHSLLRLCWIHFQETKCLLNTLTENTLIRTYCIAQETQYSVMTYMGKESKRVDIHNTDSLCCTAETNTTL